jgi:uncharacterized protein
VRPVPGDGDRVLVIMAKAPRPGHAKTRLSREYPVGAVLELYRCLLADTIALASAVPNAQVAVMAPASDLPDLVPLLPGEVVAVAQHGHGLAAALTSVFTTFADGSRCVIALDSDSPHLPPRVLARAFDSLLTHDVVVGPTDDGGYYLVGARAPHAGLFDGDRLGTSDALRGLLARVQAEGLSHALMEEWFDVDVAGDLARLAAILRRDPAASPRTARLLRSWPDLGATAQGNPTRPE